jgi:hypothetical protein
VHRKPPFGERDFGAFENCADCCGELPFAFIAVVKARAHAFSCQFGNFAGVGIAEGAK